MVFQRVSRISGTFQGILVSGVFQEEFSEISRGFLEGVKGVPERFRSFRGAPEGYWGF